MSVVRREDGSLLGACRAGLRGAVVLGLVAALPVLWLGAAWAAPAAKPAPDASAKPRAAAGEGGFLGDLSLSSRNEPIVVRSDQLEFDYQQNRVVYRGTVNVRQGDLAIDCKELIVNLTRAEGEDSLALREVVAVGDVVITQGTRRATGGRAVFDQVSRRITLLEDPVLHDGPNEVTGEKLVVYLDEGRSVFESSPQKRVSAILYPGKSGESGIDLDGGSRAAPRERTAQRAGAAPAGGDAR